MNKNHFFITDGQEMSRFSGVETQDEARIKFESEVTSWYQSEVDDDCDGVTSLIIEEAAMYCIPEDAMSTDWDPKSEKPKLKQGEDIDDYEILSDTVIVDPIEPPCTFDLEEFNSGEHNYTNYSVQGTGGGVIITENCSVCGLKKTTNTWAQNPTNGSQGHTSLSYRQNEDFEIVVESGDVDEIEEIITKKEAWAEYGSKKFVKMITAEMIDAIPTLHARTDGLVERHVTTTPDEKEEEE